MENVFHQLDMPVLGDAMVDHITAIDDTALNARVKISDGSLHAATRYYRIDSTCCSEAADTRLQIFTDHLQ